MADNRTELNSTRTPGPGTSRETVVGFSRPAVAPSFTLPTWSHRASFLYCPGPGFEAALLASSSMMVLRRVPMLIPVLPGSSGVYAPGPGLPMLDLSRLLSRPEVAPSFTAPT